jgi:hypothetical protein
MPTRSDFAVIRFGEHLGDRLTDLHVPWAVYVGNQSTVKSFTVDAAPIGDAYLLIQALGVSEFSHKVLINGAEVGGFNLPPSRDWQTWMVIVNERFLKRGSNTIQVVRDATTPDDFVIGAVVVHWRERE